MYVYQKYDLKSCLVQGTNTNLKIRMFARIVRVYVYIYVYACVQQGMILMNVYTYLCRSVDIGVVSGTKRGASKHFSTLQHTATHFNTSATSLQHHCNTSATHLVLCAELEIIIGFSTPDCLVGRFRFA